MIMKMEKMNMSMKKKRRVIKSDQVRVTLHINQMYLHGRHHIISKETLYKRQHFIKSTILTT